jgi:hypothetical protein
MEKKTFQPRTPIEHEVLCLHASLDAIGSMVSYDLLKLSEKEDEVIFRTSINQRLFIILLVDFISVSKEITGKPISLLNGLVGICETPRFEKADSCSQLRDAAHDFKSWLEIEIEGPCNFPSIQHKGNVKLTRKDFIGICGDISKHSFVRLDKRARDLVRILEQNGRTISPDEALLLLEDFDYMFYDDAFNYRGSHIAEKLNNIRWGIYEYLKPEIERLRDRGFAPPKHQFDYPNDLVSDFVRHSYRELVKNVFSPPYFKQFKTRETLTQRF